jgi:hypothetical protein
MDKDLALMNMSVGAEEQVSADNVTLLLDKEGVLGSASIIYSEKLVSNGKSDH